MTTHPVAPWLGAVLTALALATHPEARAQTNTFPEKPKAKPGELFPDTVVAKGKGLEIKRSQVDDAVVTVKANIAAQGRVLTPEETALVEKQVTDRLIQMALLLGQATEADRAKGKELFEKRFEAVKSRAPSEESFQRQLKAVGMTEAIVRARMTDEATAETVLERELKVLITDEDVKKYYDQNPARFEQPETLRASHILLATRDPRTGQDFGDGVKKDKLKKAEELLKQIRDGEDFAKLARDFSEDTGSKERGGELPPFPRGQMMAEFETAAFALKTNQVSEVVSTAFGYHLIKAIEKIPAKKIELAKVADDIKQFLKAQELQKGLPDYVAKLRKAAGVEILDDSLKLPDKPPAPAKEAAKDK
jgi:peptidyl-prolyl cis-trans isomerase C